jgi:hypothetical protein
MLRAVGGFIGNGLRTLAFTRDNLPLAAAEVFLLLAGAVVFAAVFLVASFFFVDDPAGAAGVVAVADSVEVVPVTPFATSLFPGQRRQIKTAATRYHLLLSRIPSRSNYQPWQSDHSLPFSQTHNTTLKPRLHFRTSHLCGEPPQIIRAGHHSALLQTPISLQFRKEPCPFARAMVAIYTETRRLPAKDARRGCAAMAPLI